MRVFNALRLKSIKDHKISKYLLYAFGEIILIVVGVLLALQLNIQNQKRISDARQLDYLLLIRNEMESNLQALDDEIADVERITGNLKNLMDLFSESEYSISEDSFRLLLHEALSSEFQYNHKNGVLNELISSGGLRELENDSLSNHLAGWGTKISWVRLQEKDVYDFREAISNELLENGNAYQMYPSMSTFKGIGNNWTLLKNQKFTNAILVYYGTSRVLGRGFYQPLRKETEELIEFLNNEIAKNKEDNMR